MTIKLRTIHGKAPQIPALTAQRSKNQRIQYAVVVVTLIVLGLVYGVYGTWQEYYGDPTYEHLFIGVFVSLSVSVFFILLAYFVVPKVEFFENHLVERSLWGFSRQRRYQEISKLEVKHGHLYFRFNDRGKILISREEIKLEDLAQWLVERGVTAAQDWKSSLSGTSENWGSKHATTTAVTLQGKTASSPVLTVQARRWHRIYAFLFGGVPFILCIPAEGILIGRYLSDPENIILFSILFLPLPASICFISQQR